MPVSLVYCEGYCKVLSPGVACSIYSLNNTYFVVSQLLGRCADSEYLGKPNMEIIAMLSEE